MSDTRQMIADKLEGYIKRSGTPAKKADIGVEMFEAAKSANQIAKDKLSEKFDLYMDLYGLNTDKTQAQSRKYYDMGISEILGAERKAKNLLTLAADDMESFINDEVNRCLKQNPAHYRGLSEEQARDKALEVVAEYTKYGAYHDDDKNKEAHDKYTELLTEYARCNTEYNAVLLAKQNFIEENADLIAEAQKEKRKRELKKSGLLEELDLVEKAENEEIEA